MNKITNVNLACDDDIYEMAYESTNIVYTFKDNMSFVSHI